MKFLPKLRACLGGATIAPTTAETSSSSSSSTESHRRQNDVARSRRSTRSESNRKKESNWKPKLRVIVEDGVVTGDQPVRSPGKNSTGKARAKPSTKVPEASRHRDDYRKSSSPVPIPAFSPAPFLI